ncbi:hypothetical protein EJ04DRAFT_428088 [Polyplosphaeria fusca]|uniref:HTH La-type RNA-binding domain-containing protein n=1 Tax=Polyplosphaeria fusca TaxID=682080 RepID=A0A9P4V5T3_9PLEO|nr:hypothetical protein EJ04DRAFT_428088 [Polyplosphaeria fusca]
MLQVEYYFSDENLPTDLHMLQNCEGSKNVPVSISRLCGFNKMRKFKPKSMVVAALRKSAFLDVTEDGKRVSRKMPLALPNVYDGFDDDGDDIAYDPRTKKELVLPIKSNPQTKTVLPPGMTKNLMKPTGFEDTYVEPPITPAEAEEESAMYDPDKSFVERIEIAIQRFKSKKRMHEKYSRVFNKWMEFGGIDSQPNLFAGLAKQDMANMDAMEIARAKAAHFVPWDRDDANKWEVDFVGVAEAFLSSYYPKNFSHESSQVKTAIQVLRSFYNYLLSHNVCDEYRDDLLNARVLCDKADKELPRTFEAGECLPGEFNRAASTLFKGYHADLFIGDQEWAKEAAKQEGINWIGDTVGMQLEQANVIFRMGVTVYGNDEQYESTLQQDLSNVHVVTREDLSLEVTGIEISTEDIKQTYTNQNEVWKHKLRLQTLGKIFCRSIHIGDFDEYNLPSSVSTNGKLPLPKVGMTYEFWVDDEILTKCFEGMKMDAQVITLDNGITILDRIRECMPSFHKVLLNELWCAHKPKTVRLTRKGLEDVDEALAEINGEKQDGEVVDKEVREKDGQAADDESDHFSDE